MRVLLIGNGYLAGTLLTELLAMKRYRVTVVSRRAEAASPITALGAEFLQASLDDLDALRRAAEVHDVSLI
jgi:uncharacterized protein YbjT (DUF2867 family)